MKLKANLFSVLFSILILVTPVPIFADSNGASAIMDSFNKETMNQNVSVIVSNEDGKKHKILFIMGVILLILIFLTAGLGLAMALHGKELFVGHMLSAGATVFLAVAHAVTSIVWFYPY
ncbi:MAG: hypothetical protein OEZ43_02040 [Gammaproteobacteria bacterium]|nr:hypothetical protein [Gammaproteobacteria bacterium]